MKSSQGNMRRGSEGLPHSTSQECINGPMSPASARSQLARGWLIYSLDAAPSGCLFIDRLVSCCVHDREPAIVDCT